MITNVKRNDNGFNFRHSFGSSFRPLLVKQFCQQPQTWRLHMDKVNGAHGPFSAVLLIFTLCGLARGDEIYLSDGRVIDGVVVSSPDADIVDVRVGAGTLVAIQHFPKAKVQRVVYGISSRQTAINEVTKQIATLSTRKDVTASEWWSVARRLYDFGEISSAKELAARVVMIDRGHREARKLLGMTLYHGV
jgi:hypothetical protein